MDRTQFLAELISLFPAFENYWSEEDIHRETDGSYTVHGLLSSFFHFYQDEYGLLSSFFHFYQDEYHKVRNETVKTFAFRIEAIVAADPHDKCNVANAICTSFLELIDEDREGRLLEAHLGEECKRFLNAMRGSGS